MKPTAVTLFFALSLVVTNCAPTKPEPVATVEFSKDIKPLLKENCLPCHHSQTLFGGMNLESRHVAFRKSENGTPIVPGNPDASLIYTKTDARHGEQDKVMPADGILLNEAQRDVLRSWIEQGADWPDGEEGKLTPLRVEPGEA